MSSLADISVLESLQNKAHESMGLSGLAAFNATTENQNKVTRFAKKAAMTTALAAAIIAGKVAMPSTAKVNRPDRRHHVTAKNKKYKQ